MKDKGYSGIDYFRIAAAVLVVAIHTSPLSSYTVSGDFFLTRVIGRVAVPFFFMAAAFFMTDPDPEKKAVSGEKFFPFAKKTLVIYMVSALLYLPINFYNGYFQSRNIFRIVFQDLLFEGTFYHLWYLPASVLGMAVVCFLLRTVHHPGIIFAICGGLYLLGLFGDSYYGFIKEVPILGDFYRVWFFLFDYTRSGLLLAPLFMMMGVFLRRSQRQFSALQSLIGFVASMALMTVEAFTLNSFDIQRHDSMYFMLVPTMYFLFRLLMQFRGNGLGRLRSLPLYIYIIHPSVLILVRGAAKAAGMSHIFVDNSLVCFLSVLFLSAGIALSIVLLFEKRRKMSSVNPKGRAWLQINTANLRHNAEVLNGIMPAGCEMMAVVKANAYGHGDVLVSTELQKIGVKSFAVCTVQEGIRLRENGIKGEILVFGYTHPEDFSLLYQFRLTQTVVDADYAEVLNRFGKQLNVHIKVDTGMHRLGESWDHTDRIASVYSMENLSVTGIYSHLCTADDRSREGDAFARMQIERFYQLLDKLGERGIRIGKHHLQSSYGLLNFPELRCDYARIGIALYGSLSLPGETKISADIRPVMSLKSRVSAVRIVSEGECVGYGGTYTAARDTLIAAVAVGYADGYPRELSGKGAFALVKKTKVPVIGRICMDQLMLDVTEVGGGVRAGETVTLIGSDGEYSITGEDLASRIGSITNELYSRLGDRLELVKS